jgi:outer membrane protein TolC
MEFVTPSFNYNPVDTSNHRPELDLFALQTKYALQQSDFMSAIALPKLSFFVQGGYGRPGLNYLVDEFDFFYIGGIKLNYPLWQGNAKKYDAGIYQLNTQTILHQQQVFELNTDVQSEQQKSDIDKYDSLIELDNQIVALREKTKIAAAVQLENGVITSTDYVNEVNATLQAQQNLSIHQIQLLTAKANYLITTGKL